MKVVAVVQARMGSSRLPGKVMRLVKNHRLIDLLLLRLGKCSSLDQIVIATTDRSIDDPLARHLSGSGFRVVRGSERDVLARYAKAAKETEADVIVRITGDCPMVMPELVDAAVDMFLTSDDSEYVSNVSPPTFADGLDVEVFSAMSLFVADQEAKLDFDREHVTPYIKKICDTKTKNFTNDRDDSWVRLTVDEPDDLRMVEEVLSEFSLDPHFSFSDLSALIENSPHLFSANSHIKRNDGASMGKGQKLWRRAKAIIPGGNMLLSKRAEMLLPDFWPTYFERSAGCSVWDLDGNLYKDVGYMGIGTNTLGYAHPEVDHAVKEVVEKGNLTTLNCREEVDLAERLLDICPFGDMVRFARTGGEANAVAIRIARAASGRDGVAICGYHGWHDWYLSANLSSGSNLDGHLLPGLEPMGVPKSLANSVHPFMYNDLDSLKELISSQSIGVIKMEVYRNMLPEDKFLEQVRSIANKHRIVLIFDECTSGFRETYGGLHKKYDVEPDMAVFGKTLGNGYAITAVVGKQSVMEAAQSTFISSTFWTERIGPAAALKTLEIMEREKSWDRITELGQYYVQRLSLLSKEHGVPLKISGLPSLTTWSVDHEDAQKLKTLVTQEMLKAGYLAPPAFYASLAHSEELIDEVMRELEAVFEMIADCVSGRKSASELLDGPVCHSGFNRLN